MKIADLSCDIALLQEAQSAAERLLQADPELSSHPLTAQRVEELFQGQGGGMN